MKVITDYSPPNLFIRCVGELDHHTAAETLRRIEQALDRYLPKNCALDFSALTFMDSSGIAVILRAQKRMRETGGSLVLVHPMSQPEKVLSASGIHRFVDIRY
ncbi:MAG: STAS domain-containing protein [Oscillospiraceae bacterium]|nr:STAS domain-containing protein [Oscillospiraceae bacterium]